MLSLRGSFVALVTPFRDGKVDEPALRALARWQLEQGTDGLVPCGTTGEGATLSADESVLVIRACVEESRAQAKASLSANQPIASTKPLRRRKRARITSASARSTPRRPNPITSRSAPR